MSEQQNQADDVYMSLKNSNEGLTVFIRNDIPLPQLKHLFRFLKSWVDAVTERAELMACPKVMTSAAQADWQAHLANKGEVSK
jgi:hypothetical protein